MRNHGRTLSKGKTKSGLSVREKKKSFWRPEKEGSGEGKRRERISGRRLLTQFDLMSWAKSEAYQDGQGTKSSPQRGRPAR